MPVQRLTRAAAAFSGTTDPNMPIVQAEIDAILLVTDTTLRNLVKVPHAYAPAMFEFFFDDTLTGTEVTAFDGALAAHTGTPLSDQVAAVTAPNGGGTPGTLMAWGPTGTDAIDSGHASAPDPHTVYQLKAAREQASGYAGLDASSRVIKAVQVIHTTEGGGVDLTVGSIANGEVLVRSGAALVGQPAGSGSADKSISVPVVEPHAIRDPASAIVTLRKAGTVTNLRVTFGAPVDAGTFEFVFKIGPPGGALTTLGTVTLTAAEQTDNLVVASVAYSAGDGLVIEQTDVGSFLITDSKVQKRATCTMHYTET